MESLTLNSLLLSFRSIAVVLAVTPVLFSQHAFAQSTSASSLPAAAPSTAKPTSHVETSVSVGAMAQLTPSHINDTKVNLSTQSLTPSAGVFGTFRQSFKPWLGYSVNFGYTYPTFRYTLSAPAGSSATTVRQSVQTHMYEISISYIAQKHLTSRFSLFGEAGGGTVAFAANNTGGGYLPNRSNAFRAAGITGFGANYYLAHGFGLRAQYRGIFIRYPYPNDDLTPKVRTFISEPTLSLTYNFGRR